MSDPGDEEGGSFLKDGGMARALAPFKPVEMAKLQRFLDVARRLANESPLFAAGKGAGIQIFADRIEATAPVNRLEIAGLLTDFRQLYRNGEECSYYVVAPLLGKHTLPSTEGDDLRAWLKKVNKLHKERLKYGSGFPWTLWAGPKTARADELINDWLNGDVMHGNPVDGQRLQAASQDPGHQTELLTAVQSLMEVYVPLARILKLVVAEPALLSETGTDQDA